MDTCAKCSKNGLFGGTGSCNEGVGSTEACPEFTPCSQKPRLCLYCQHLEGFGMDQINEELCLICGPLIAKYDTADDLRTLMERASKCKDWKEIE